MDLRAAARRLTEIYDKALSESGITISQFSQIYQIKTLGSPTLKELSAASELDRSTLGRNIRVMEKQNLVEVQVGKDARTRTIKVSRKGNAAFEKAVPLWLEIQQDRKNLLGAEGRETLIHQLQAITGG